MVKLEFEKSLGLSNVTCIGLHFVVFNAWGSLLNMVFAMEEYLLILESSSS
jgi:hypothetical protein